MSNWFAVVVVGEARYVLTLPDNVDNSQRAKTALKLRLADGKMRLDNGDIADLPDTAEVVIASLRDRCEARTQHVPRTELVWDNPTSFTPADE
jgi:hypothetical protein